MKGLRDEIANLKRTNTELINASKIEKESHEKEMEDEKSKINEAMKVLQDEIEIHKRNYAELNTAFEELMIEKRNLEKVMQTKERIKIDEIIDLQDEIKELEHRNALLTATVNELENNTDDFT